MTFESRGYWYQVPFLQRFNVEPHSLPTVSPRESSATPRRADSAEVVHRRQRTPTVHSSTAFAYFAKPTPPK